MAHLTPHDRAVLIGYSFRSLLGEEEQAHLAADIEAAIQEAEEALRVLIGEHHALHVLQQTLEVGWCQVCLEAGAL
mgnify:FL=1